MWPAQVTIGNLLLHIKAFLLGYCITCIIVATYQLSYIDSWDNFLLHIDNKGSQLLTHKLGLTTHWPGSLHSQIVLWHASQACNLQQWCILPPLSDVNTLPVFGHLKSFKHSVFCYLHYPGKTFQLQFIDFAPLSHKLFKIMGSITNEMLSFSGVHKHTKSSNCTKLAHNV